jgi:iron complex outermembrane receptor protein
LDVQAGAANYRTWTGDLYATGGLTDTLAADIAVHYSKQDEGYGVNLYPGTGQDVYADREADVRSKWLWTPTDRDKITVALDYSNLSGSAATAVRFMNNSVPLGYPITPRFTSSNPWDVDSLVQPDETQDQAGASVKIEHALDFARFTSISAYREVHNDMIFDFGYPPFEIGAREQDLFRQASQEFQLASNDQARIKWTTGLYYLNEHATSDPYTVFGALLPADNVYTATAKTDSAALYGQATTPLVADTNLTTGLRYTFERSSLDGISNGDVIPSASQHFGKVTWRLALDHRFTDSFMAYISDSRGFRAGAYNATQPTQPAIQPETLDAYEIGTKANFLDDRVRMNTSAFYYKYSNMQVPIYAPAGIIVLNAANARLYGADWSLDVRPLRNLTISTGVEWLHTQYRSFDDAPFNTPETEFPFRQLRLLQRLGCGQPDAGRPRFHQHGPNQLRDSAAHGRPRSQRRRQLQQRLVVGSGQPGPAGGVQLRQRPGRLDLPGRPLPRHRLGQKSRQRGRSVAHRIAIHRQPGNAPPTADVRSHRALHTRQVAGG